MKARVIDQTLPVLPYPIMIIPCVRCRRRCLCEEAAVRAGSYAVPKKAHTVDIVLCSFSNHVSDQSQPQLRLVRWMRRLPKTVGSLLRVIARSSLTLDNSGRVAWNGSAYYTVGKNLSSHKSRVSKKPSLTDGVMIREVQHTPS